MKTNTKKSLIALMAAVMLAIPLVFAEGEPENVTGVSASPVDSTSIGLTWNSAKDASGGLVDHYRIYYGSASVQQAGAGEYDAEIDTTNNNTAYVVTSLLPDTTYYFSVTAFDGAGLESEAYSLEDSAVTPGEGGEAEGSDVTSPTVIDVEAPDKIHVKILFSEAVRLPALLPEVAFTIAEQINPVNMLEVTSASIDEEDETRATVLLETAEQTKNVNYIVTAGVAVMDLAGNPIMSGSTDSGLFLGSDLEPVVEAVEEPVVEPVVEMIEESMEEADEAVVTEEAGEPAEEVVMEEEEEDVTPPEDITNLMLDFKEVLEKFTIMIDWTASINSAKDLIDQMLYQSMDRGRTYDAGASLGPVVNHHEVSNLEGGKEYTFKITTKDEAGNESVGVVKSIRLPQTGVGLGLLLLSSAGVAGYVLRRKK